jgi:hypothetical protein
MKYKLLIPLQIARLLVNTSLIFSLIFCALTIQAQKLIDSEYLQTTTKEEIFEEFGILPSYDVDMYRVLYETNDIRNQLDTASGLLVVPVESSLVFPLAIYAHGTLSVREDVPSNLGGGFQLAMAFGAYGYICIAPDFLGMGTSRGFHPYVHADSEASASIDMLFASKEFLDNNEIPFSEQLFITGYSQGGHAAMAIHRELEMNFANEFTVTASAPLSGPYSISEKMVESTLGENEFFYPGFLPYTALSYRLAYPELLDTFTLDKIFKAPYVETTKRFENREISISELNNQLINILQAEEGNVLPKEMIQDHILDQIFNVDTFSFNKAMRWNDVYEWAPVAPTKLYYCMADDQVFFENSLLAEQVMNDLGASNVDAVDLGSTLDHNECVIPAALNTVIFFSLFRDITSSNAELSALERNTLIYPNPVANQLIVSLPELGGGADIRTSIFSMTGQLQSKYQTVNERVLNLDVSQLHSGMYVLLLEAGDQWIQKKFVKQ